MDRAVPRHPATLVAGYACIERQLIWPPTLGASHGLVHNTNVQTAPPWRSRHVPPIVTPSAPTVSALVSVISFPSSLRPLRVPVTISHLRSAATVLAMAALTSACDADAVGAHGSDAAAGTGVLSSSSASRTMLGSADVQLLPSSFAPGESSASLAFTPRFSGIVIPAGTLALVRVTGAITLGPNAAYRTAANCDEYPALCPFAEVGSYGPLDYTPAGSLMSLNAQAAADPGTPPDPWTGFGWHRLNPTPGGGGTWGTLVNSGYQPTGIWYTPRQMGGSAALLCDGCGSVSEYLTSGGYSIEVEELRAGWSMQPAVDGRTKYEVSAPLPIVGVHWWIAKDTAALPIYERSYLSLEFLPECEGLVHCSYQGGRPGRMYADVSVQSPYSTGYTTGSMHVMFDAVGAANPALACTPASVTRATEVVCRISNLSGAVVQGWEFVGEDFVNDPTLKIQSTSSANEWRGPAVAGGVVTARILVNGLPRTLTSSFTVTNRATGWRWGPADWRYSQGTAPICNSTRPTSGGPLHIGWNRNAGVPQSLCQDPRHHRWVLPDPVMKPDSGYTLTPVPGGPNAGRWYVSAASYRIDRASNLNPHWLASGQAFPLTGPQVADCVHAGLHPPIRVNLYTFNEVCKGQDVDRLIAGAWGHEGFGAFGGKGHQGLAEAAAAQTSGDPLYAIEWLTAATKPDLRTQVLNLVDATSQTIDAATDDLSGSVTGNFPGGQIWLWHTVTRRYVLTTIPSF